MATIAYIIVCCLLLSNIAASPLRRPVLVERSMTNLGVGNLQSCLLACSEGTAAIQAFCRTIPLPREWIHALSCVQAEERCRVMKFVYKKDAKSALIGRLLLRKVLAETTGIPYLDINLGRTERGKPYLLNGKVDVYFNISHQGDFVVLAAESSVNVGIDVMKTEIKGNQTVAELFHTMRRQFTSYEWQTIQQRPSERKQLEIFMRHWCLKESYVKALGVGIGLLKKLQSIEFHITPQSIELDNKTVVRDTKLFLDNKLCNDWSFEETKLDEDHQVVVALQCSNLPHENEAVKCELFKMLTIGDLLPSSIPFPSVDEQLWKNFEQKKESPWKR